MERFGTSRHIPFHDHISVLYLCAMAPSADRLEDALRNAVEEVYRSEDQNNLTVRFVRDKVEIELGLDQGFFLTPEWKDRSKLLIKSWAVGIMPLQSPNYSTNL